MAAQNTPDRDAVIFIPGLGGESDQSLDGLAHRMAAEMTRNAPHPSTHFCVADANYREPSGSDDVSAMPEMRSVYREDGGGRCPVLDICRMVYQPILTRDLQKQSSVVQSLRFFVGILANLGRLYRMSRHPAKKAHEKFQFLFAIGILLLLSTYAIILIVALVQTILQIPQIAGALSAVVPKGSSAPAGQAAPVVALTWSQLIVIIGAIIQTFAPNLGQLVASTAIDYLAVIGYVGTSESKDAIGGHFADLLQTLSASGRYRRIHVIAYSFGALVALDNLFPAGWQPVSRIEAVDTLVTIGCPFDIVRMLWPNYFTNRRRMPGRPRVWINIYSPADILASNFRDDNLDAEADKTLALAPPPAPGCDPPFPRNVNYNLGVNPNDLNLFDWLSLVGLRAHNGYWGGSDETELSCFHEIAMRLYGEDPIAAGLPERACAPAGTPSASPELTPASSVLPQTERLPDSDPGTDGDGDGESNAVVDRETDLEPELNAVLRE